MHKIANRHLYTALITRLFHVGNAYSHAFQIGRAWSDLMPTREKAKWDMVQTVFTAARAQEPPLRALQATYDLHSDVQAARLHMPNGGACAVCAANGQSSPDTSEHRILKCPLAILVQRLVYSAWKTLSPQDTWVNALLWDQNLLDICPTSNITLPEMDLRRAMALGLRPQTMRDHPEAFTLVRSIMIQKLDAASTAAWHAPQSGAPPAASDLYRTAATVYGNVRHGLQEAIHGEHAKLALIERRLLAAGCKLPQIPPTARWRQKWRWMLTPSLEQTLLPRTPPWATILRSNPARLAPRPDWAPPAVLPAVTQVYVATSDKGDAWAVVAVRGGDAHTDANATLSHEGAGPMVTDALSPLYVEATGKDAAVLHATHLAYCLAADGMYGPSGIVIRVDTKFAHTVAGMHPGEGHATQLEATMRKSRAKCAAGRQVWLAGSRQGAGFWWADRATALANQCASHTWGPLPREWSPLPQLTALQGDGEECPICLEDFSDPLPRPREPNARAPQTFHTCGRHATCIGCDARKTDPRCCICRAPRAAWVYPQ